MTAIEALNHELARLHNSGGVTYNTRNDAPKWAQDRIEYIVAALCEIAKTQTTVVTTQTDSFDSDPEDYPP